MVPNHARYQLRYTRICPDIIPQNSLFCKRNFSRNRKADSGKMFLLFFTFLPR